MPEKTKRHIFRELPDDFYRAYKGERAGRWVLYHKQRLTAEDVRELKVLWQLTANVDLVCQRVVELAPGGGWQTNVLVAV